MTATTLTRLSLLILALLLGADARAVTIDWVPVGNPGNANDPADGDNAPGIQNFGAVPYSYRIDKYDVTNSQYVEFLNAKDPSGSNALGLFDSNMSASDYGGINNFNGSAYTLVSGAENHPVNFVSWYNAIRFANWLNNGQGNGDTETGAYTLGTLFPNHIPINGPAIKRNPGAVVFLPSEDEWYKAAYYNPGPPGSYFLYPTSSNTAPTGSSPTALPNHANIDSGGPVNLTDVGAYTGTTSPYGAFDMAGNVWQWNEALVSFSTRGIRGGSFDLGASINLRSSGRAGNLPTADDIDIGFRVASIPEPSTGVLAIIAGGIVWWSRRRFR